MRRTLTLLDRWTEFSKRQPTEKVPIRFGKRGSLVQPGLYLQGRSLRVPRMLRLADALWEDCNADAEAIAEWFRLRRTCNALFRKYAVYFVKEAAPPFRQALTGINLVSRGAFLRPALP